MAASESYIRWLEGLIVLHRRKSAGYVGEDNPDPWANFRECEAFGVPAELGCMTRLSDKWSRIKALMRDPANEQVGESLGDTMDDMAAYAGIYRDLRREREERHARGESTELELRWFYKAGV